MRVSELIIELEELAPPMYAEGFDNIGLLVGSRESEVEGVLVTLDCLEEVVDEAISKNINTIVTFHPIIFSGLKSITGSNYVERVVLKAIEHKINIYAIHTNLDAVPNGVNFEIANRLGLRNLKPLISQKEKNIGMGRIGEFEKVISEEELLKKVQDIFSIKCIKHTKLLNKSIKRIAVLGGSGAFAIKEAIAQEADVYITADIKYHEFFQAENKILLMDIGHYESEQFTKNLICEYLTKKNSNLAVRISEINTNPVKYF